MKQIQPGDYVVCRVDAFSVTANHSGLTKGIVYRVSDVSTPGGELHVSLDGVVGSYYAARFRVLDDSLIDDFRALLDAPIIVRRAAS